MSLKEHSQSFIIQSLDLSEGSPSACFRAWKLKQNTYRRSESNPGPYSSLSIWYAGTEELFRTLIGRAETSFE
jgi:hypothetical protein